MNSDGIAVIGFGSLIWDIGTLRMHTHGPWREGEGPELPLEFSRISMKRNRALTVCVDLMDGTPCQTAIIASRRNSLREARVDLARREMTAEGNVGTVDTETGEFQGRGQVAHKVMQWAARSGWRGAVWTDLLPSFTQHLDLVFTEKTALDYLQALPEANLRDAIHYLEFAPRHTNTRFRRRLRDHPWWREKVAEHLP